MDQQKEQKSIASRIANALKSFMQVDENGCLAEVTTDLVALFVAKLTPAEQSQFSKSAAENGVVENVRRKQAYKCLAKVSCWFRTDLPDVFQEVVKCEEELQPPIAVFIGPTVKQETLFTSEDKDPLASCCDGASVATIKQEITACSPGDGCFSSEKTNTMQTQQSHSSDLDCIPKSSNSNYDQTTQGKDELPNSSIQRGKRFKRPICDKMISRNGKLHRHMLTHTAKKPFQCSICEKTLTQKGHLARHMRTHTGEKPFQCSVCEKTFTQKGHLDKHMRTHTGEKPFHCSICEKTFAHKGTLDIHMRTHSAEKTF
ncbi:Protein glass, partial [Gryllus bimaculatus]